jgi:DNA-binding NarL/FixJ family response regulator
VLSQHDSWDHIREALGAGASGYLIKTSSAAELVEAIRCVARGERYLSADVTGRVVGAFARPGEPRRPGSLDQLTAREREVLQLIAEGLSSREIADELVVSVRTVEAHRSHVMEKLDIHKVAGLVRFAIREGLVAP